MGPSTPGDRIPIKTSLKERVIGAIEVAIGGSLIVAGVVAVVIGTLLPWAETKSRNVEYVLVGHGFGLPPGWYAVRPFTWYLATADGNQMFGDARNVVILAGTAGLIGLVIVFRRGAGSSIAGIVALSMAVIAWQIVAADYQTFSRWIDGLPAFMNLELGPGAYLAATGIMVWTLGGLIAIVGRLEKTPTIDFQALSRLATRVPHKPRAPNHQADS